MLVLTRKRGDTIFIGDGPDRIVIKIINPGRSTAKIGIQAPPHMRILRAELASPACASTPSVTSPAAPTPSSEAAA